jgi:hypothetical protein
MIVSATSGQFCVYKHDEQDRPVGPTLGCHDTRPEAEAQMAALYAAEPGLEKSAKFGARHSAKDRALITGIRQKVREIDQHAVDLGAQDEQEAPPIPPQPGKADVILPTETPLIWGFVKAAGDWTLDVLGVPYGSPDSKDSDGEYFDAKSELHSDKWPWPPAVYYHGFGPDKKPMGDPEYIGKTVKRWIDAAGVWYRVVLDKASALARRVWDAAQKGVARASSGSIAHLTRIDEDGHIREWPVVELSVFDATDGKQPANRYAVAIPTAKAIYRKAGLEFTPEAEPEAGHPAATAARDDSIKTMEVSTMDAIEMQKAVADAVAAQFKAREDEAAAKATREADIAAAVKAEKEKWDAEAAKDRRLPGGMPHVRQYSVKYDNLTPAEHALVIGILKGGASQEIVKALALKINSEKDAGSVEACKMLGLKSDEVMHSDLSSYGSDWIGTIYSKQLWDMIRAECWVLDKLQPFADQVPDGYVSDVVPLESTDPTWYKVAEVADLSSGRPAVSVTASQVATSKTSAVTLVKMGCRVAYSGELKEDSLIPIASQIIRQMKQSGLEQFEHALIDGDTTLTASTNINDIAGTPAGTEVFCLVDGFRHYGLATSTQYRSGGALEDTDYIETARLLGTAGISADPTKCQFIVDMPTYWKSMQLANVKSKDVWSNATLESGQLKNIWGFPLKPSAFMHYLSTSRKANTAGKVNHTDQTANTTGSILCVRWDQWRLKWKRAMTIETDRWIESDVNQIVAMVRWGLGVKDTTNAAAITYGITGV